ncbi:dormancy-associated protein homolog 4 isoform X1 [Neltuma alba]|uniref:dormancy-associated protein homolog 4 isoform X1 n=1 Tax=Neltuma alba TaxID=207710 RepID=UPI0010A4D914|nr:dormancy-associated protein homolog 4-like isoform X1 [Prosopis alba]
MGFLHKLWDETLAGPAPESGLGKLRKYDSFPASSSASPILPPPTITRSITIVRTSSDSRCFSSDPASLPDSPSGPTTPRTPSTPGTPAGDFKKFTRRKSPTQAGRPESTSPNISDWVIMSAFDR